MASNSELEVLIIVGKGDAAVNEHECKDYIEKAILNLGPGIRKRLVLRVTQPQTINDLKGIMRDHKPRIIQFLAHGTPDARLKIGGDLLLPVSLKNVFKWWKQDEDYQPEIVMFTACNSADLIAIAGKYAKFVVAAKESLSTENAREYAAAFYRSLVRGKTTRDAHKLGLTSVKIGPSSTIDLKLELPTNLDPSSPIWNMLFCDLETSMSAAAASSS